MRPGRRPRVLPIVFGATVPLVVLPYASPSLIAFGAASCIAALILLAGYDPPILAHYRIELGADRSGPRHKGEPAERRFAIGSMVFAAAAFIAQRASDETRTVDERRPAMACCRPV